MPQASAVWSADPRQMWTLPGALPGRVLRQPRDARPARPPAVADGRRRLARYVEALVAPVARPPAAVDTPVDGDPRATTTTSRCTPRGGEPERFDEVVLATHSDQALRDARRRRPTASTSCSARSPTSPTRRCCTPTARCSRGAAAPGRAGTTTCSTSRPACTTVTYHMNRLQSLRRRPRVLRDAQPHARRSTRSKVIRTIPLRAPGLHAPRASPRRRATTRSAAATARTTAAPTGAGASTRTASSARVRVADALRSGAPRDRSALYEGTIRHRRFAVREHEFRHRIALAYVDLDELPRLLGGRLVRAGPGSCASAAATTSATRPCRSPTRCARSSRAHRARARRADPPAHAPAHARPLLQPGQLLLLLRRRRRALEARRRRGHQHAVGRAPRLRAPAATARVLGGGIDKALHVSPFMGMDQRYAVARRAPGADAVGAHREPRGRRARVRRDARACERRPLTPPRAGAPRALRDAADARADLRPRASP